METIGDMRIINREECFRQDWNIDGWVYKNYREFEKKSHEVCYIPESGIDEKYAIGDFIPKQYLDVYSYWEILAVVKKHFDDDIAEKVCEDLFFHLRWTSPEVLLEAWINLGYPDNKSCLSL